MHATSSPPSRVKPTPASAQVETQTPFYKQAAAVHCLWILAFLLLFDLVLTQVKPLQYVRVPGVTFRDADYQMHKIDLALDKNHHTDVLLLGSSTLTAASLRGDFGDKTDSISPELFGTYTGATSLENGIKNLCGKDLKCTNVGISAAMASDDLVILDQYLQKNDAPRAVILLSAPRDLADRNLPNPEKSRIVQHFHKAPPGGLLAVVDNQIQNIWQLYGLRGDYQQLWEIASCSALGRAATLYAAVNNGPGQAKKPAEISFIVPWREQKQNRAQEIAKYKETLRAYYARSFGDVPDSSISEQVASLTKIAERCRDKGTYLVLVTVPISAEFAKLTPAPVNDYLEKGQEAIIAQNKNCLRVNFSADDFTEGDFADGLHFSTSGANKFWEKLAARLNKSAFVSQVCAR